MYALRVRRAATVQ